MKEYTKTLKKIIDEELDEIKFNINKENFLENLKLAVEEKDYDGFNVLTKYFITYSLNDTNHKDGKYSSEIRQYYYDMIMNEKYDYIKDWTDHEYGEVANSIILERMEEIFKKPELMILSKENKESLKESFLIIFLEYGYTTLIGMLKDEFEYFTSIKHKIEMYVYYSLFSLELMIDALVSIKGKGRDYIPNRKYSDEMFEYANNLYWDAEKRLKQDEVILNTLKKYNISLDKYDSFRVRWGVYNRKK